jgi:flagellar protein FliO/FliZ
MLALLQAATDAPPPPSYGASLLQTLFALIGVCLLAYVLMRYGLGRTAFGRGAGRYMRIRERLPLDARRALVLVEVGDRVYLVGTGDGAAPTLLRELPPEGAAEAASASEDSNAAFRSLLDREP